jgi:hypothetical protein
MRKIMIRINQLKLPVDHTEEALWAKAAKTLKIPVKEIHSLQIIKQSVDARKKEEIHFTYCIDVETAKEESVIHKARNGSFGISEKKEYFFPKPGTEKMASRPVIIGAGPAGLFCGLMLARHGYRPLLLERGESVEKRRDAVDSFWNGGILKPDCNVQFGEGGAGTFSDGKLNTLVKDPLMRNRKVLELFVEFGADPSIIYVNKPHIGTDVLSGIVKGMREEIIDLGGEVRFNSRVTDFIIKGGRLQGVMVDEKEEIPAETLVLAIGHSARDTFEVLNKRGSNGSKGFCGGIKNPASTGEHKPFSVWDRKLSQPWSGRLQAYPSVHKWKRCLYVLYVSRRICRQCILRRKEACSKRNELSQEGWRKCQQRPDCYRDTGGFWRHGSSCRYRLSKTAGRSGLLKRQRENSGPALRGF